MISDSDERFIKLHLDWLRRKGATAATRDGRKGQLRRLAEWLPCDLLEANPTDLDEWQSSLTVSITSIATYSMHTRGFYRWALEAGHISLDPACQLPIPKVPNRQPRPILEEHFELALVAAFEPLRTWLLLAGFMGLRAHEIAQIRLDDVEEIAGRLWLRGTGKGQKPYRLIVPSAVESSLRRHMRGQSGQRGPLWRIPPSDRPATAVDCTRQTTALMRSLGLHYTLHALRHRFGTQFYDQTRDLLLTANVMRHDDLSTTRGYVATSRSEATDAMDRLSQSLGT